MGSIVVDCARRRRRRLEMLTLPATSGCTRTCSAAASQAVHGADDGRSAVLAELLESARAASSGAVIADRHAPGRAHLVLTPERVVAAEAVRTLGRWRSWGSGLEELLVNAFWCKTRTASIAVWPDHPAFHAAHENEPRLAVPLLSRYICWLNTKHGNGNQK